MHYMLANVIAIVLASVSHFLANDRWTPWQRLPPSTAVALPSWDHASPIPRDR